MLSSRINFAREYLIFEWMCHPSRFYMVCMLAITVKAASQDYFSYGGSNYSGLMGVTANPAAASGNFLKLDIMGAGVDLQFNNSWLAVKQNELGYPVMPSSWKNSVSNTPNNIYKNFNYSGTGDPYSVILEQRIMLPSVMYQADDKNTFAFSWSMRQNGNVDGISRQLAYLFEHEFDLSVTRNNRVQNKSLTAMRMNWIEYGFTYARRLTRAGSKHCVKAGITPKLLQGVESAYLVLDNLDFLFSNKDTLSYFNAGVSYARSAGVKNGIQP